MFFLFLNLNKNYIWNLLKQKSLTLSASGLREESGWLITLVFFLPLVVIATEAVIVVFFIFPSNFLVVIVIF
ncbi:hypothetical protein CLV60_10739 [Dyadobacter jiangsuensis]|uniref:Uncharacterized protein n=1 Tax=Dyadobacter jiangsuensis TaxID=1591085 RepID=A0A2P8G1B3_9BACT|nr:hypothetical protein CLV60_10739 [Dyadobacter jiangsuensis]